MTPYERPARRTPFVRPGRPGALAVTACALLAAAGLGGPATAGTTSPDDPGDGGGTGPRNVILLVADGMGYNHVAAASLWENGTARYQSREVHPFLAVDGPPSVASQVYQHFPVQLGMDTGYVFSPPYGAVDAGRTPSTPPGPTPTSRSW